MASDSKAAARLEMIRLSHADSADGVLRFAQAQRDYAALFETMLLGTTSDAPAVVAHRIRSSNIGSALIGALDDWSLCSPPPDRRSWLLAVSSEADHDLTGFRVRVRSPEIWLNGRVLAEALAAPVEGQPVAFLLAACHQLEVNHIDSLQLLRRIQHAYPGDFWANLTLGDKLKAIGRPLEAVGCYKAAMAVRPRAAITYNSLGAAFYAAGQPAEALTHFERALALDPGASSARANRAMMLTYVGRYQEALPALTEAIDQIPKSGHLHLVLGDCLAALNRGEEAIPEYRKSIELEPSSKTELTALTNLGVVQIRLGQQELLKAAWKARLDANPADHEAWNGYADFCLYSGDADEFKRVRSLLLQKFQGSKVPGVCERTARTSLLLPLDDVETGLASALVERALASPSVGLHRYYRFAKGLLEYRLGHFEAATAFMEGDASITLPAAAQLVVSMARYQLGQVDIARRMLANIAVSRDWSREAATGQEDWISHVLLREAENLIVPDFSRLLSGDRPAVGNAERLLLIAHWQFIGDHTARTSMWAECFVADPALGNAHRLEAAGDAALAAVAPSARSEAQSDTSRAHLRDQALTWLKLELGRCTGPTPQYGPRQEVRVYLRRWQTSPALAPVRDANYIIHLSSEERLRCEALWADVQLELDR